MDRPRVARDIMVTRLVTLPPDLAYGDRGAGDLIGPNEVLMFEIELLEVRQSTN